MQIDWLKKTGDLRHVEKRSRSADPELSLTEQCQLLGVQRSSYYYRSSGESEFNLGLMHRIDEINLAHPTWGSRMIRDFLALEGVKVNRKRIQLLEALLGVKVMYPKRTLSRRNHEHKVYPYLLKGVSINQANPSMECGYHLHTFAAWVCVPGGDHRLALSGGAQLEVVQHL